MEPCTPPSQSNPCCGGDAACCCDVRVTTQDTEHGFTVTVATDDLQRRAALQDAVRTLTEGCCD